jgi:site-specific recombinase XerD
MDVERDMREWCNSFKSSRIWLNAVKSDKTGSEHTQVSYCKGLKSYCDWIGKTPDELIATRKTELKSEDESIQMNAENKLREFCNMLEEEKKVGKSTVVFKYHAVVKSFYSYNNVPLKLKTPRYASKERQPHTVEELKALMNVADVRERSFMMILKDSGISREDVVTLRYKDIKSEYEANKEVIHVRTVRQKEQIEYDTFIGRNAIECLKAYLDYRQRMGETINDETPLLATLSGKPLSATALSQVFVRLSEKVGFMTSPHRFRKFFESHLGLSAPSILVKSWMGHALGVEKAYFIPPLEKQREKYIEAYKEIDLYKTETSEVETTKQTMRVLWHSTHPNATPEQERALENIMAKVKTRKESDDLVRDGIENRMAYYRKKEPRCEDGNCQKLIQESEVETWLAQGWKVVSVLPSGKIVISNE